VEEIITGGLLYNATHNQFRRRNVVSYPEMRHRLRQRGFYEAKPQRETILYLKVKGAKSQGFTAGIIQRLNTD
jgi:hypothetical protein